MTENETPKDEDRIDEISDETNATDAEVDAVGDVEASTDDATESPETEAESAEAVSQVAAVTADTTLAEAIHLADELVKTRIEKIHEAGERSVSQAVQSMETLMSSVLDSADAAIKLRQQRTYPLATWSRRHGSWMTWRTLAQRSRLLS